jgi:hypothetical protein
MLTQNLNADQRTNEGTITITCEPGNLAELLGLHEELKLRANFQTGGVSVREMLPEETPPPA